MTTQLATAEWADPNEFAEKNAYKPGKFWLGRSPVNGKPLGYDDDRHVCLVSGSRSGKGTTTIIPNLCLWPGSVVVVDPKGENATITAARRGVGTEHCEGMGQAVHVLDPFGVARVDNALRSRFNPLDAIDPESRSAIDQAGSLADAIVVIPPDAKEKHWDESARTMIKSLILHVLTSPLFRGRRNLITVRQLITRGDHVGIEAMKRQGREKHPTAHELLWYGVSKNEQHGGVIAGYGQSMRDMLKNSPRPYNSILQIASRNTEFLDSPDMRRCLEASDFKLSELKTDPKGISVFLSLPPQYMGEHFRWLRMLVTLTVFEMQSIPQQPASGHRVLVCLDEFAGLERMNIIETAVAQIAGFGVKLFFVLQSLEQLKATYPNSWETFLANSGLGIFYGVGDHFTRDHVSKMVGETELIRELATATETENEQTTTTSGKTSSKSWNVQETEGTSEGRAISDNWQSMPMGLKHTAGFIAAISGNRSATKNKNRSSNKGTSKSGGGSDATQESRASASGRSTAIGRNESLQKRPLITSDEVGRFFGRIDDKDDPVYPGLGLTVHVNGTPSPVQRVNYFEDLYFRGLFTPHPDHPTDTVTEYTVPVPDNELITYIAPSVHYVNMHLLAQPGKRVRAGDPLLVFVLDGHRFEKEIDSVVIRSPASGLVISFEEENYVSRMTDYDDGTYRAYKINARYGANLRLKILATDIDRAIENENADRVMNHCIKVHRLAIREKEKDLKKAVGLTVFMPLSATLLFVLPAYFFAPVWVTIAVALIAYGLVAFTSIETIKEAMRMRKPPDRVDAAARQ